MALAPGKGFHIDLTEEALSFLAKAASEAFEAMGSAEGRDVLEFLTKERGWTSTEDKFGEKAHTAHDLGQGNELRVTVVYKHGQLKLDARTWFTP